MLAGLVAEARLPEAQLEDFNDQHLSRGLAGLKPHTGLGFDHLEPAFLNSLPPRRQERPLRPAYRSPEMRGVAGSGPRGFNGLNS